MMIHNKGIILSCPKSMYCWLNLICYSKDLTRSTLPWANLASNAFPFTHAHKRGHAHHHIESFCVRGCSNLSMMMISQRLNWSSHFFKFLFCFFFGCGLSFFLEGKWWLYWLNVWTTCHTFSSVVLVKQACGILLDMAGRDRWLSCNCGVSELMRGTSTSHLRSLCPFHGAPNLILSWLYSLDSWEGWSSRGPLEIVSGSAWPFSSMCWFARFETWKRPSVNLKG